MVRLAGAPRQIPGPLLGVGDSFGSTVDRFTGAQLNRWKEVTSDPWLLRTLTECYRLQFRRRPPLHTEVRPTVVRDPQHRHALQLEIVELLQKGAIEHVDPRVHPGGFYSTYFLVTKKDGGFRPILDLRGLNCYLKELSFRMLRTKDVTQSVTRHAWFTSVDLKDAYFHVPIARDHRRFLRFAFQGSVYQYCVLPFGLSLAPRVFTRCVQCALAPLQRQGLLVLPYLDDWLVVSRSSEQAAADTRRLLSHVAALGFTVNWGKSSLTPSQSVVFLGVRLDSRRMLASLTPARRLAIRGTLALVRGGRFLPHLTLLRLAGLLAAAAAVVRLGLLHLRPFQCWLNSLHLSPLHHKYTPVRVSQSCLRALAPWRHRGLLRRGVPLGPPPARREVVTTDASMSGWGGVWNHQGVRGSWGPGLCSQHVNLLELMAVWLTLRHFSAELEGRHVLVRTDSTSVVFFINHQGSTRSRRCLALSRRLLVWADRHLLSLRAAHIPGVSNRTADVLSRGGVRAGDWCLNVHVAQMLWRTYGRAEVDLFATRQTSLCPLWFAEGCEPGSLGQDALAHDWPDLLLYAFPPPSLIWMTLARVLETGCRVLLVAPCQPARPWFPLLLSLLVARPCRLPHRQDLLSQVQGSLWHPHPERLDLWAWPLGQGGSSWTVLRGSGTLF